MAKNHGGRGMGPKTGTRPKLRTKSPVAPPGMRSVKGGPTRGAGRGKHAAAGAQRAGTSLTRKAGPRKTRAGTTTRSGDR